MPFLISVLGMWFIARYFSCGVVCVCSSQAFVPEECFLYLVSVNICSFYIFCTCLVLSLFIFGFLICSVRLGVSSLASLSHSSVTDYCEKYFVLRFTVSSSLLSLCCCILLPRNLMTAHLCLRGGIN